MHKIVFFLLVSIVFCCTGIVSANNADVYISAMEAKQSSMSPQQKIAYQKKTFALLSLQALRLHHDATHLALIHALQHYLKQQFSVVHVSSLSSINDTLSISKAVLSLEIPHVDIEKVRSAWLQWHNEERAIVEKSPLQYHAALESTATTWAQYLGKRNGTTHRRSPGDGYYDYSIIKQRFIDQGIVFAGKEVAGQTLFMENLGWNVYSCKKDDCTDEFIEAIRTSWMFFMSEKGKSYRPHYNAIVGNYSNIGLGVVLAGNRYYLVSHYAQDLL